jgi:hypothetical protein
VPIRNPQSAIRLVLNCLDALCLPVPPVSYFVGEVPKRVMCSQKRDRVWLLGSDEGTMEASPPTPAKENRYAVDVVTAYVYL